jgi:ribosomal protein S18 acetylase RimI-like enzyme
VSEPDLDALAEAARNRGLKLVRSRVRTPGKRRFGKVGLTDASGKPVLGMDAKGPTAKPEELEEYLRNLGARDWGASLDVAVLPRKKRKAEPPKAPAAAQAKPKAAPKQTPKPKPQIRDAKPSDAAALVQLSALLGAAVDEKGVRKRVTALAKDGVAPLVATLDNDVVGVCAIEQMLTIHRDKPVGRISHLVVAEEARRQGIGRMLTEAAEQRLRNLGCELVEITSNDRLAEAHAFYRHMGYERTSIRFAKPLTEAAGQPSKG